MMLTKDELKAAIVASVAKLGHVPSRAELLKQAGVTPRNIRKHFGTYQSALEACGLERNGAGQESADAIAVPGLDWNCAHAQESPHAWWSTNS